MSLKKSRVIAFFGTLVFSFLFHFLYDFSPNFITSIFVPFNSSIWEHMKILYSSIIFYGIIDYFFNRKFSIGYNNFFLNLFLISFSSVLIYLAIFLPIYFKIGESMFLSIGLMVLVFIIVYYISYFILGSKEIGFKYLWICFIIFGYIIFGYLTYKPIHNQLFFDTHHEVYGIK